jgi:alkanesulfonate monooxygenase SsuD/methylene tetrahydromethanopterin reductase-like flavin-dependent oxidoreductase (luciferase family)
MRFDCGLLAHVGDISNYPQVDEWRTLPPLLESCGYTGVWSAEHHFAYDLGITPTPTNPLLFGAFAANITEKLRIGQCGVCMPAWHPFRVAEDAATLDHMTGGRLDFGFMKGLSGKVSTNYDVLAERTRVHEKTNSDVMWEMFDIITKWWSGKPFRHDGTYFTFPYPWKNPAPAAVQDPIFYGENAEMIAIEGVPSPLQTPRPPCYTMVDSVGSHIEAARRGVAAVCWANTFEGTREVWAAYREAAADASAAGTLPAGAHSCTAMMRPTFVHETPGAAEAIMRPAINGLFANIFGLDNWLGRRAMVASDEELSDEDVAMDWYDFFATKEQNFIGTPEEVTEKLKRYESELGAEHLIMYWAMPELSFEQMTDSVKLFADKVMPHFSDAQPRGVLSASQASS